MSRETVVATVHHRQFRQGRHLPKDVQPSLHPSGYGVLPHEHQLHVGTCTRRLLYDVYGAVQGRYVEPGLRRQVEQCAPTWRAFWKLLQRVGEMQNRGNVLGHATHSIDAYVVIRVTR